MRSQEIFRFLIKNYQLFQTVFCKTSFTHRAICVNKHRPRPARQADVLKNALKIPLSKWTLASLYCKAIHLMLFLHRFLQQLWKLSVFSVNLNLLDRFENGSHGGHRLAIFSGKAVYILHCFQREKARMYRRSVKVYRIGNSFAHLRPILAKKQNGVSARLQLLPHIGRPNMAK